MKTRTLYWFGGAAVVCAWAVVYLGADYACRYPESRIGKWYLAAYEAAVTLNPVSVLSRTVASTAAQSPREAVARAASKPHAAPEAAVEPQPVEIINLTRIQDQAFPPQIEDEPVANAAAIEPVVLAEAPPSKVSEPADVMPPCIDEQENLPVVMPHADDAEESQEPPSHWLVEFWKRLFYGAPSEAKWELPAILLPTGDQEESEPVPGGKAPLLREDSSLNQQYPGCPFMERCPGVCPRPRPIVPAPAPPSSSKNKNELPKTIEARKVQRQIEDDDAEESEDRPRHPDVDTMEFRRSDAHPGDFDPIPF